MEGEVIVDNNSNVMFEMACMYVTDEILAL
jgi:hypothetical protein